MIDYLINENLYKSIKSNVFFSCILKSIIDLVKYLLKSKTVLLKSKDDMLLLLISIIFPSNKVKYLPS